MAKENASVARMQMDKAVKASLERGVRELSPCFDGRNFEDCPVLNRLTMSKRGFSGLEFISHSEDRITPWTHLFHIMPLKYFLKAWNAGVFGLSSLYNWMEKSDKLEAFLYQFTNEHAHVDSSDGRRVKPEGVPLLNETFGMSWSAADEKPEMWVTYGKDNGHGIGVRIGVNARDLLCTLCKFYDENISGENIDKKEQSRNNFVHLENVVYKDFAWIKNECTRILRSPKGSFYNDDERKCVFTTKSRGFSFEEEVRLYVELEQSLLSKSDLFDGNYLKLKFKQDIIKSVTLSPNANAAAVIAAQKELLENNVPESLFAPSSLSVTDFMACIK